MHGNIYKLNQHIHEEYNIVSLKLLKLEIHYNCWTIPVNMKLNCMLDIQKLIRFLPTTPTFFFFVTVKPYAFTLHCIIRSYTFDMSNITTRLSKDNLTKADHR